MPASNAAAAKARIMGVLYELETKKPAENLSKAGCIGGYPLRGVNLSFEKDLFLRGRIAYHFVLTLTCADMYRNALIESASGLPIITLILNSGLVLPNISTPTV